MAPTRILCEVAIAREASLLTLMICRWDATHVAIMMAACCVMRVARARHAVTVPVLVAMLSKGKVTLADPKQAEIAAKLAKQHKDLKLTPAELLKITNWVDTNAQYYGSWWGRRIDYSSSRLQTDYSSSRV